MVTQLRHSKYVSTRPDSSWSVVLNMQIGRLWRFAFGIVVESWNECEGKS